MSQKENLVAELVGNKWGLFIAGKQVNAGDDKTFDLYSPANGEKIATVAAASPTDVDAAVINANEAFTKWSSLTAYDREKIIKTATAYVRTQADRIGMLMALEQGKPFTQSKSEITASCDTLDYYAAEGVRIEGYSNPTEKNNHRSWVIYQPIGVCAVITPWNYPVSLLSWKLGPALATGCTIVVKPTHVTPLSPLAFCIALTEGGIPPGVINVVTGTGAVTGEALIQHPLVKKIAMTGSTATGKRIMKAVAGSFKKVSLELGGQCPAIVCADADLDNAAQVIAYKGFRNCGQSCSSVNRVYVHTSVEDAFVNKLKMIAEKMTIGDGVINTNCDLGPLATKDGLTTIKQHIQDAINKGAKLVTGGDAPKGDEYKKGNYLRPAILTHVTDDMLVMKDETFGPVVPVQSFENIDDAVAKANDSIYGLVAYLFTSNLSTSIKVSEALESGTVSVNCSAINSNYAPYEGWKESGFGSELSRKAVFEYLKTKHIKIELL
jgi:succinate-semialdehyde dehydrogenase / glutarate-semialdehyde dehydrogenase